MSITFRKTYQISISVPPNIDAVGDNYIILRANTMEDIQAFLKTALDETLRYRDDSSV